MSKQNPKNLQKISVKIWRPIIEKLDGKIELACLRRDAYLAKVLECELDWLDQEVSIPNSQAAHNFVCEELDGLDRKLVSLALPPDLTKRLNDICTRKRIVRDAFFNRLFLLLAASPKLVDHLLFGDYSSRWRSEVWSESKNDGPFFRNGFYPLEPMIDPFWAVRRGLELVDSEDAEAEDLVDPSSGLTIRIQRDLAGNPVPIDSVYTIVFDTVMGGKQSLLGMSCFMPDSRIPGHEAEKISRAKLDELFHELEVKK